MAEPFLGEIRLFGFGVVPKGWIPCEGQLLPISRYAALFSLLGVMYGGDGKTIFGLPDLRGRLPLGYNNELPQGVTDGEATHVLAASEMPAHTHQVQASTVTGAVSTVGNNYWAGAMNYAPTATGPMASAAIAAAGGGQAHENMQPYTALNFCIALNGIFPSRN
jgi:microcystin-dependent protein